MTPRNEKETTDEVVQDIRRTKEILAESMGFDIDCIVEDARKKQKEGGRKILSPPIRQNA